MRILTFETNSSIMFKRNYCLLIFLLFYISIYSQPADSIAKANAASGLRPVFDEINNEMVFVEGGTFIMGCTAEQDCDDDEKKVQTVTVKNFSISKYEVTNEIYEALMDIEEHRMRSYDGRIEDCPRCQCPVEPIGGVKIDSFIDKLNSLTGMKYRLPTSAEWEYAARGGNKSLGYKFAGGNIVNEVAWYDDFIGASTQPVGQKKANELGLCDMSGNAEERCSDKDKSSPEEPGNVLRGGSNRIRDMRVSSFHFDIGNCCPEDGPHHYGFRLARTEDSVAKPKPSEKTVVLSEAATAILDEVKQNLILVKGGTFTMGCGCDQGVDCPPDEKPAHPVTLRSFYIDKFEVTQVLWEKVMPVNPSRFKKCPKCPVEWMDMGDVQHFIEKLDSMTGKKFRLPTEAEWEYAARGGSMSKGFRYSGSNNPDEVAWYSDSTTHPVGLKKPNEIGIYDMTGNVAEYCSDRYHPGYYAGSRVENPLGPISRSLPGVIRGGQFNWDASFCRISNRYVTPWERIDAIGLRLVLDE